MGKLAGPVSPASCGPVLNPSPTLYHQFISNIKSRLPAMLDRSKPLERSKSSESPGTVVSCTGVPVVPVVQSTSFKEILAAAEDQFLATAFRDIFRRAEAVEEETEAESCSGSTILGLALDPLMPLESIMADSLSVGILRHYNRSCVSLVKLFKEVTFQISCTQG